MKTLSHLVVGEIVDAGDVTRQQHPKGGRPTGLIDFHGILRVMLKIISVFDRSFLL